MLNKQIMVSSLLALPMVAALPLVALAGKEDFSVINAHRRATLVELYVSSSGRDTWDNDILGSGVLYPGEATTVVFGDANPNHCLYDIKAVFSNGAIAEEYSVNVCRFDHIYID